MTHRPGNVGRRPEKPRGSTSRSLFWEMFIPNAVVLAVAVAILSISPIHVPPPSSLSKVVAVLLGLAALLVLNLVLMQRAFRPLRRLTALMRTIDPLAPGKRVAAEGGGSEVLELARAFNQMLDRIESERLDYGRRTVAAQEEERRRLARELHDEIGQTLTALMLQLRSASRKAPPELSALLGDATETSRTTLEGLHAIVRLLRPEALDDLGLESAIVSLADGASGSSGLEIHVEIEPNLPKLTPEEELVVYRIAQESLTNVMRHAGAERVLVGLQRSPSGICLVVEDDGRGLNGAGRRGGGIRGMRERALLVGASLDVHQVSPEGGVEVRLELATKSQG